MKKKIILSLIIIVSISLGILIGSTFNKEEASFDDDDTSSSNHIVNEQTLSMMIEQTAGAGDYKLEERTSWPTDGYMFNSTLSKCENGGELGWDETKGVITMTGNMSDKCYIYFDIYSAAVVNSFTYTATSSSLTITASATKGTNAISKYYFSINNGSYNESSSNSYTFSSLSAETTYTIKIKVKDSSNKESAVYSGTAKTSTITLADYCSSGTSLATCIKTFANQGSSVSKIYYHNGSLTNGISDNSYRYAGASAEVNNYVCFGSTATTCPTNNLYRIIGVFNNQVKLIKSTAASSNLLKTDGDYYSSTSYYWNYKATSDVTNTWSTSLLNKTNLNTNYINYIGSTWSAKIATTTWKVGGNTYANIYSAVPATAYANEITSPVTTNSTDNATTYSAKIGLMYVSDYGFAADPSAWTTALISYHSYKSVNWMALGSNEWTISRRADDSETSFYVASSGYVFYNYVNSRCAVRPVFYLTSSATYSSGTGTSGSPIRLG